MLFRSPINGASTEHLYIQFLYDESISHLTGQEDGKTVITIKYKYENRATLIDLLLDSIDAIKVLPDSPIYNYIFGLYEKLDNAYKNNP